MDLKRRPDVVEDVEGRGPEVPSPHGAPGPASKWRIRRPGPAHPRPLPARRTVRLSVGLVVASSVLWLLAAPGRGAGTGTVTWWELALGFAAAELVVFHIQVKREAHTFSLSEVPFVLGLFFAHPLQLLAGRLIGEAVILVLYERQSLVKVFFNLSMFLGECTAAISVFHLLGGNSIVSAASWGAAAVAVGAASALSASCVALVIRWHGGATNWTRLLSIALLTTSCNIVLALLAGLLVRFDPPALALLGVVGGGLYLLYRGYTSLTQRYSGLEILYQFARVTSAAQRPRAALESIANESRQLLRSELATILVAPPEPGGRWLSVTVRADGAPVESEDDATPSSPLLLDVLEHSRTILAPRTTRDAAIRALLDDLGVRDALVAPLVASNRVTGVILVADRLGDVSTFDAEDARLLSTLASQAAVAIENGRLIEQLHIEAEKREHEALHDPLTELANRTHFRSALEQAIADAGTEGRLAVMIMDIDRFKEVNDALGHQAGDQLLETIAKRIKEAVGSEGTVARLGGDEFAVLLPRIGHTEQALGAARAIHARVASPATVSSLLLEVEASIGVSVLPDDGVDSTTLMRLADVAMYEAKSRGGGVALYDRSYDWNTPERLRLASDLRSAIGSGELEAYFQPVVHIATGEVVGAEALARWKHPHLGLLSPDVFIPLAERAALLDELTMAVLDQSLDQLERWGAAGYELSVSVNLPVQALLDLDFPAKVGARLTGRGIGPDRLVFEITESGFMSNPTRMLGVLDALDAMGVGLAIDDFGTGYSSLSYLHRLPAGQLKIDKSFVLPMGSAPKAASIVRSIIELGRTLGMTVVAEGVEDAGTISALRMMGCERAQGFHIARPLPADDFVRWLAAARTPGRRVVDTRLPAPLR